ncbi:MAG TPA: RluA family pseudouridine synthase [Verrucomicrobiae bacterium]|nr:RluA family pseudouridine synthase [Verrucomicrobiae bacterium]
MEKLFDIIHEDEELLVVNKPAGLVCHPTKNGEMSSLIGRARLHLAARVSSRADNLPHLVNRLDRETSGVVLIAKNSEIAGELGKILESRAVEKEYLTIVHGHVAAEQGTIDAPLGKDERSKVAVKDCVRPDGAPAQTKFVVEKKFVAPIASLSGKKAADGVGEGRFSLLRVFPQTGRKHQIRIHLAHISHPIVGDKVYGGDEDYYLALVENRLTDKQRTELIFENHALHAYYIRFHWRDKLYEFSCEPEAWFRNFCRILKKSL